MDEQNSQSILDLPKLVAGGIAAPAAALLTSNFGVAGTLVGLALSAVIVTVISDVLKVYLARAPGAVTRIPGGFSKKPRWQQMLYRVRQPFSKFASLAPARRRSILIRSLIAGGIMFVIGLIVVTGLEVGVGKSLSCWVWNNCPTETSASGSNAATPSSLPSILGGGSRANSNAQQVVPVNPQQPTPAPQQPTPTPQQPTPAPSSPGTPVQSPNVPNSQGSPGPLAQPGQQRSPSEEVPGSQQQGPSGGPSGNSGNQQSGIPFPPAPKGSNNQ